MVLTIKELIEHVDFYGAGRYSNKTSFRVINARMRIKPFMPTPTDPPVPAFAFVERGHRFYETSGALEAIFEYKPPTQSIIHPNSTYAFTLGGLGYQDHAVWGMRQTMYLELVDENTKTIHVLVLSDDASNITNIEIAIRNSWMVFKDATLDHQTYNVRFFPLPETVGVTCTTIADSIGYFLEML
jgi:hypothetical protein